MTEAKKQPLRVLHVFGSLGLGGAESRTVELYRAIDRERVQFDFLVHTDAKGKDASSDALMAARAPEHFDETVRELGARIFAVPRFRGANYHAYRKALCLFFAAHCGEWGAVHGHMTSTASVYLPLAGDAGAVPLLIAHARNAGVVPGLQGLARRVLMRPLQREDCPWHRFAVSRTAGEDVFGAENVRNGSVRVIPNALRLSRYVYDAAERLRIRKTLGIGDEILLGHVGRFHYQKNHEYLLRVFAACRSMEAKDGRKCRLLLIGEGERMEEIRALAAAEGIGEDVIFAGKQSGIAAYYAAMDAFLFPSHYEGMPGVVLEAQAAGLPCLISDRITKETDVTALVTRLPLTLPPERWAEEILSRCKDAGVRSAANRKKASEEARDALREAGFDVETQAERMLSFYLRGDYAV